MKKTLFTIITVLMAIYITNAQVGIGTTTPGNSAVLELQSTEKGFLPPRLTESERDNNISTPATGLIIYNTTVNQVEVYDGTQWTTFYKAFELKVEYKSADFSITKDQRETLFVVNEAAEVTLPSLSSVNDGFRVYVKRTGGLGLVSVLAATGDIIEGILSVDIGTQGGSLEIVATASEWVLLNGAL